MEEFLNLQTSQPSNSLHKSSPTAELAIISYLEAPNMLSILWAFAQVVLATWKPLLSLLPIEILPSTQ